MRPQILLLLLASLPTLVPAFTGCRDSGDTRANQRGHGPLVAPYADSTRCALARYAGPETPLYSNRPYHTDRRVESAAGLAFCRGERHGTSVWILRVSAPTRLVAFGNAAFGLESRGWAVSEERVRVEAAGVPFDQVYTLDVGPGRYVVRQGFSRTAPLVFWDEAAVRVAR